MHCKDSLPGNSSSTILKSFQLKYFIKYILFEYPQKLWITLWIEAKNAYKSIDPEHIFPFA